MPSLNFNTVPLSSFRQASLTYIAAGAAPARQDEPNAEDDLAGRIRRLHLRILVVDDEGPFRESVVHMLRTVYESLVDEAEAASAALEKISRERGFDFILMDVVMPKVSGIEACRRIQAMGVRSQIVLMSAHPENRATAKSLGVEFLDKPLNWETVEKILLGCQGDVAS